MDRGTAHTYSDLHAYSEPDADAKSDGNCDRNFNSNADINSHSDTLHGTCGSERTNRNQCDFQQLYRALEQR